MQQNPNGILQHLNNPVKSQALCSLTNFVFNFMGIAVFSSGNFSIWFIFSFINVFIQSVNRNSFLELFLLNRINLRPTLIKSLSLTIVTNILSGIYLAKNLDIDFSSMVQIILMFILYQLQDVLRYIFLNKFAKIVTFSDFTILILIASLCILERFREIESSTFIGFCCVSFSIGSIILLTQSKSFMNNPNLASPSADLQNGLLMANLLVFLFSCSTISIIQSSFLISDLVDYRVIVIWLSPVAALIRLFWIKLIAGSHHNTSKTHLLKNGAIISSLLIPTTFFELVSLHLFATNHVSKINIISLVFGLLTVGINTWTYPILVQLLRFGTNALTIAVFTVWNPLFLFCYVVIFRPKISLIEMFTVGLVSMALLAMMIYWSFSRIPLEKQESSVNK